MSLTIGHTYQRSVLEKTLPHTALLLGPTSIGKATLAREIFEANDLVIVHADANDPAWLLWHAGNVMRNGAGYIIDMAGMRDRGPFDVFMASLPEDSYAWMVSDYVPEGFDAWTPRVLNFLPLEDFQVAQILRENDLLSDASMIDYAALKSDGQVKRALEAVRRDANKQIVLNILKAVHEGDQDLLSNAIQGLTYFAPVLSWWVEAKTGRWDVFSEEESYGCDKDSGIMSNMVRFSSTPAKIAARGVFWPACEKNSGRG